MKKPNPKPKGLTDQQLIEKYESGKINLKLQVSKMLKTPSPTAPEKPMLPNKPPHA